MNREIKFRAWIDGHMYYNHSVSLSIDGEIYFLDGAGIWIENKNVVLMQYTNLLDMRDQRIFDGDIILWYGPLGGDRMEVYWRNGSWNFKRFQCEKIGDTVYQDWKNVDTTQIEVVGNIHQNKELLCI